MAKLEVRRHAAPLKAGRGVGVKTKVVRGADGEKVTVRVVDSNSDTFGRDFLYVFKQNVRKARKENRERFGSSDRVRDKA